MGFFDFLDQSWADPQGYNDIVGNDYSSQWGSDFSTPVESPFARRQNPREMGVSNWRQMTVDEPTRPRYDYEALFGPKLNLPTIPEDYLSTPSQDRYREFVQKAPAYGDQDTRPSNWRRLAAALGGISAGWSKGPGAGYQVSNAIVEEPYQRKVQDWTRQAAALKSAADVENASMRSKVSNVNTLVREGVNQAYKQGQLSVSAEKNQETGRYHDMWKDAQDAKNALGRDTLTQKGELGNRALDIKDIASKRQYELGKEKNRITETLGLANVAVRNRAVSVEEQKAQGWKPIAGAFTEDGNPILYKTTKNGEFEIGLGPEAYGPAQKAEDDYSKAVDVTNRLTSSREGIAQLQETGRNLRAQLNANVRIYATDVGSYDKANKPVNATPTQLKLAEQVALIDVVAQDPKFSRKFVRPNLDSQGDFTGFVINPPKSGDAQDIQDFNTFMNKVKSVQDGYIEREFGSIRSRPLTGGGRPTRPDTNIPSVVAPPAESAAGKWITLPDGTRVRVRKGSR